MTLKIEDAGILKRSIIITPSGELTLEQVMGPPLDRPCNEEFIHCMPCSSESERKQKLKDQSRKQMS
jgi:hypothetical protein